MPLPTWPAISPPFHCIPSQTTGSAEFVDGVGTATFREPAAGRAVPSPARGKPGIASWLPKGAGAIDADLRIYELDLANPTEDFTQAPAMSEKRTANAMAYGMMAAEPGIGSITAASHATTDTGKGWIGIK